MTMSTSPKPTVARNGSVSRSSIRVTSCPIGWKTGQRISTLLVIMKTTANMMPMKNRNTISLMSIT